MPTPMCTPKEPVLKCFSLESVGGQALYASDPALLPPGSARGLAGRGLLEAKPSTEQQ